MQTLLIVIIVIVLSIQPSAQKPTIATPTTATDFSEDLVKKFHDRLHKVLDESEHLVAKLKAPYTESTLIFERIGGDGDTRKRRHLSAKKGKTNRDRVVVHLRSVEDITLSPCKLVTITDKRSGGYNIHRCAPREDQKNKLPNLECRTVYRRFQVVASGPTREYAYVNKLFPIGCELRYTKAKKNCNRHIYSNTEGC